jgi:hypothetical protein
VRPQCRQLAFQGNTGKSTVVLMPTMHCLTQLVEAPYTVISLNDIEIVSLERVGFNTSTFDLVIIFKDFSREVYPIGSVPAKQLDDIRKWLSVQDIKFFESKIPLQWKKILKQIADDPEGFLEVVRSPRMPCPSDSSAIACKTVVACQQSSGTHALVARCRRLSLIWSSALHSLAATSWFVVTGHVHVCLEWMLEYCSQQKPCLFPHALRVSQVCQSTAIDDHHQYMHLA